MLREDVAVVDATAEWLYDRIMDERKVWYEDRGYYVPPFNTVDDEDKDMWREDADKLLAVVEKALRG